MIFYHSLCYTSYPKGERYMSHSSSESFIDKFSQANGRTIAMISYFSIIGWVIALLMHGKNPSHLSAYHLRQTLGLLLTWVLLSFIPLIGWLLALPVLILWAYGLYYAFNERMLPIPILGDFYQQSFNSLIR